MVQYEANECIKNLVYLDRDFKELERYQLYVLVNSNSKNQLKAKDILSLPWDNKFLNETEFEYNEQEKEELDKKADLFSNMLSKGSLEMKDIEGTNI